MNIEGEKIVNLYLPKYLLFELNYYKKNYNLSAKSLLHMVIDFGIVCNIKDKKDLQKVMVSLPAEHIEYLGKHKNRQAKAEFLTNLFFNASRMLPTSFEEAQEFKKYHKNRLYHVKKKVAESRIKEQQSKEQKDKESGEYYLGNPCEGTTFAEGEEVQF